MTAVGHSQMPAILATGSVFTTLSVLAVILRFVARRIKRAQFGWDDWTILYWLHWLCLYFVKDWK